MEWNKDLTAAPFQTPVVVQLENGFELLAVLEPDASMDENERACDQWREAQEGTAPDCWSEGACWASNADETPSLQPVMWKFRPATP